MAWAISVSEMGRLAEEMNRNVESVCLTSKVEYMCCSCSIEKMVSWYCREM